MTDCFSNVFQASRTVDIIYYNFTLVEATMVCMEDLSTKPYKYVINLCAYDYPLKTNFEMIRSLKDCGSQIKIFSEKITSNTYFSSTYFRT